MEKKMKVMDILKNTRNKIILRFGLILITFFLVILLINAARLPTVGSDSGGWGTILNNFLTAEHTINGTHRNVTIEGDLIVNNSVLYVNGSNGSVGIGTTSPSAKFTVVNGAILANGTIGNTPILGGGTRLMWVPARGAFRAGRVPSTEWDTLGLYSAAFGDNNTVTGDWSFAAGNHNRIGGAQYAVAFGQKNTVSQDGAAVFGKDNTVSGLFAVAFGDTNTASGDWSFAAGRSNTAGFDYAITFGLSNTVTGSNSIAMGKAINITGDNSVGIGLDSTARIVSSNNVLAIVGGNVGIGTTSPGRLLEVAGSINGTQLNISGPTNLAYGGGNVGINTTAPSQTLTVLGTLNVTSQPTRSGDLFVASSGNVGIGTTSSTEKLRIVGNVSITSNIFVNTGNLTIGNVTQSNFTVGIKTPFIDLANLTVTTIPDCDTLLEGQIIYNSTAGRFLGCNGSVWARLNI